MLNPHTVMQLYPPPSQAVALQGLYLQPDTGRRDSQRPLVYTSFITSLDGRIAIEQPANGERSVPQSIANPWDWRLFQELAARADVLLVSAHFFRKLAQGAAPGRLPVSDDPAYADLHEWRAAQRLSPQPAMVVLSSSLDLPMADTIDALHRRVCVATGDQADRGAIARMEHAGADVLRAGKGNKVEGGRLIERLAAEGYRNIFSIAGPSVLETLLRAQVLDRIYLTQVHRLIGGKSYNTLLEGGLLRPPADFSLKTLYFDGHKGNGCDQFFGVFEMTGAYTARQAHW
ncbi:MAG: RibD family protein [Thiobacillus sp.]